MKKPSSNWKTNLILVIQECQAETGTSFHSFLEETFAGKTLDTPDYELVQILKNLP